MPSYVTPRRAQEVVGVASATLRQWAAKGKIDYITTPGGKRLYDITRFIESRPETADKGALAKQKICYCRVSSAGQKDDLDRQVRSMREQFPDHKIVTDIGSGINFKRKGLLHILDLSNRRLVSEVVVAYRDRLCRFAFELIEWQLQQNGVRLLVLDPGMESENSELADDLMSIVHVFNCRMQGRKYKTKNNKEQDKEEDAL